MKKSKSKRGAAPGSPERHFVPIHQDNVLESLASGLVRLCGRSPTPAGAIEGAHLSSAAHGFSYGTVGLLELSPSAVTNDQLVSDGYVLLSECEALWLRTDDELNEIEALVPSFGDTVPTALKIRVDSRLFEEAAATSAPAGPGELFSEAADPRKEQHRSGEVAGTAVGKAILVERVAGAISMLRNRALERKIPLARLVDLVSAGGRERAEGASPIHRLVSGVLQVTKPDGDAGGDAEILQAIAGQLVQVNPSEGMDPTTFLATLCDQTPANDANESLRDAIKSLQGTMQKIVGNQLVLPENKIDDSGHIGLRGIMVFFLAPSPVFLARWLKARPEVGDGVSLVASMLVGLFVGHGRIPAEQKGPGRNAFLSSVRIAADTISGHCFVTSSRSWDSDASRVERIMAGEMEFAAVVEPARDEVQSFISMARNSGLDPKVDPDSGRLSVQGQVGDRVVPIGVEIRPSVWLRTTRGPVAALQIVVRRSGGGQLTKDILAGFLSPTMPPVWAAVGDSPADATLFIEADLGKADSLSWMISELSKRVLDLGLTASSPARRKKIARKTADKKQQKAPRAE